MCVFIWHPLLQWVGLPQPPLLSPLFPVPLPLPCTLLLFIESYISPRKNILDYSRPVSEFNKPSEVVNFEVYFVNLFLEVS